MVGKMSIGVRTAAVTPKMTTSIAITTNVYGLFSAIRTIASIESFAGFTISRADTQGPACAAPPAQSRRMTFVSLEERANH